MRPRVTTIARASQRLGKSYNQTLRLILLGRLKGWQNSRGRWEVNLASLETLGRDTKGQAKRKRAVVRPRTPLRPR